MSEQAVARLVELAEYQAAPTVMWYLDCRSELRTRQVLPQALASGKRIVVPYCTVDDAGANKLGLWWLEKLDELIVGKWKILEPPRERWGEPGKEINPAELDIVIVPGVAFSRRGGRMRKSEASETTVRVASKADAERSLLAAGTCREISIMARATNGWAKPSL